MRAPCVCVRERERVFAGVGGQFVSLCFAVSHVFFCCCIIVPCFRRPFVVV